MWSTRSTSRPPRRTVSDGHVIWVLAALYVLGACLSIAAFVRIIQLISSGPDHEDPGNGGSDGRRPPRPPAPRGPWGDGLPSIAIQPPQRQVPRRERSHRAQTRMRPRPVPALRPVCPERSPGLRMEKEFAARERHQVDALSNGRLLLLLTPWPGTGHPGAMTIEQKADVRRRPGEGAQR